MSATRYRRFLKLCEEWPRNEYKKNRDLGTFLRQRVALAFREGENTQVLQTNTHNTALLVLGYIRNTLLSCLSGYLDGSWYLGG